MGVCVLSMTFVIIASSHWFTETGYRFSESHEWASLAGNQATIGITNYAQVRDK